MPPIAHAELLALVPDFAVLSFDTALRRDAFAGRDAHGQLVIALADPADTDLVDGLGGSLAEAFSLRQALRDDVAACLARHESAHRVVADVLGSAEAPELFGKFEVTPISRPSE